MFSAATWIVPHRFQRHKRFSLQLVMAEVDSLLASVSQVLEPTSVVWGREPRGNVNRAYCGQAELGGGGAERNGSEQ